MPCMIMYAFSVRDAAANIFGRPFFVPNVGVAVRSFTDEVNREEAQNDLFNHTEDFELYELGHFDDNTGILFPLDMPKSICTAKSVKKVQSLKKAG